MPGYHYDRYEYPYDPDEDDYCDGDLSDVRCPQCGQDAEDNLWFADDDVNQDHPFCECGYEWQVAEDVQIVTDDEDVF